MDVESTTLEGHWGNVVMEERTAMRKDTSFIPQVTTGSWDSHFSLRASFHCCGCCGCGVLKMKWVPDFHDWKEESHDLQGSMLHLSGAQRTVNGSSPCKRHSINRKFFGNVIDHNEVSIANCVASLAVRWSCFDRSLACSVTLLRLSSLQLLAVKSRGSADEECRDEAAAKSIEKFSDEKNERTSIGNQEKWSGISVKFFV